MQRLPGGMFSRPFWREQPQEGGACHRAPFPCAGRVRGEGLHAMRRLRGGLPDRGNQAEREGRLLRGLCRVQPVRSLRAGVPGRRDVRPHRTGEHSLEVRPVRRLRQRVRHQRVVDRGLAYGRWRMAYGRWRMAYGVWQMAYGK